MTSGPHVGPALQVVAPNDLVALQDLFAEQQARLDVVRQHQLWPWFGGMPRGFGSGREVLWGIRLQLAGYACVFAALIAAGFTRGPVLWVLLGLPIVFGLLRAALVWPPVRKTRRLYARAEQRPGVVVGWDPAIFDHPDAAHAVAVLVPAKRMEPGELPALLAAGQRLRRWVRGADAPPADLAAFVESIRRGIAAKAHDHSRVPVPAALGGYELARLEITPQVLPGGRFASQLLFVFLDPERRSAGHTLQVQSSLWGEGVASLCATLPLEEER